MMNETTARKSASQLDCLVVAWLSRHAGHHGLALQQHGPQCVYASPVSHDGQSHMATIPNPWLVL